MGFGWTAQPFFPNHIGARPNSPPQTTNVESSSPPLFQTHAAGGIKGGQVIGKADGLGLNIVEDPIHIHALQATILHCLGLDHTRLTYRWLTYRYLGRNFPLTDVAGNVVPKLLT